MMRLALVVFIFALLFVLPIRLASKNLMKVAFLLWFAGGLSLLTLGVTRLLDVAAPGEMGLLPMAAMIVGAVIIGYGKGKFVLSKTSSKNIERLQEFSEPQKLSNVYSTRSWVIIAIMFALSASLTLFGVDTFWRGGVNLAIGLALLISSLRYLSAITADPMKSFQAL
ncbi:MAG: hypothetical protein KTR14_04705 [Vampirovibrio sp.]|nr:hypothetical protein [Vampirovibrio sp.]